MKNSQVVQVEILNHLKIENSEVSKFNLIRLGLDLCQRYVELEMTIVSLVSKSI